MDEKIEREVMRIEKARRQVAKLAHPNLAGEALGDAPGECLADVLRHEGPMPLERVRMLAFDLCAGLAAAHAAGIGHGRISPSTVRVLPNRFVLAGLGLAQARQNERVDERDDVRGVGAVLYEALTGEPPFGAPVECLPTDVRAAILRALQPHRERRHGTVTELATALGAPLTIGEPEPDRRGRWLVRAAIAVVVLGLLGAAAAVARRAWAPTRPIPTSMGATVSAPDPAPARTIVVAVTGFQPAWVRELLAAQLLDTPEVEVARPALAEGAVLAAAKQAGVELVLDGSVERNQTELWIDVKLLDVATGALRFAERAVVPDGGDALGVVEELAAKLARSLAPRAPAPRPLRVLTTARMEAWEAYVAGLEAQGEAQARAAFEQAAALDPAFFHPRARLGRAAEARPLAAAAGEWGRLTMARLEADTPDERVAAGRALATRYPHDPQVALELARAWRGASRPTDCAAEGRRALSLDPGLRAAHGEVAWCSLQAGDVDGAVAAAKGDGAETLGDVLLALGRFAEARDAYRRAATPRSAARAILVDVHGTGRCLQATRAAAKLSLEHRDPEVARTWALAAMSCNDQTSTHQAEAWARTLPGGASVADEIATWNAVTRAEPGGYARAQRAAGDESLPRSLRFGPLLAAARNEGKSAEALERVGAPQPIDRHPLEWRPLLFEVALARIELGDGDEAALACGELRAAAPGYVPGLYCLARAAEARKAWPEAARLYRDFLDRWAGAEPENRLVRDAQRRLGHAKEVSHQPP